MSGKEVFSVELQQLNYFKTVARTGKISQAAEELFVSAPALSTSISRLEKELGVQLFDRTNNRISLNAQGQILLKYVDQVFSDLESAKRELQQSLSRHGSHISLVSLNSPMWVNLIAAFTSEFPQYALAYSSTSVADLAEKLLPVHQNFLLAYESEIPPAYAEKLDSVFLFRSTPTVIVHKDHPLSQKTAIHITDLKNERLSLPPLNSSLYIRLQHLFDLYQIPFPADNFCTFMIRQKMVAENKSVSFFNLHPDYAPPANIRQIPLVDPLEPWSTRLYWRKERPLTEQEIAFRDFVVHYYSTLH